MTYTEAVELAMQGQEQGFSFLYENTYKSKLYLALQYMKNEEDAEDVLQDAYIKAFSKLDSLQDPEKFPAWLGQIVANTAKNALVKKNPVLFSDMASPEDDEPFEFKIEDEDISHQPELSYTKEETRELVRELMDSLSEEQRICILMFHIEGASIKEIAEALDCPENTVKSRLNYGRKNIKSKAEDLQKKGYKLYSLAPLPFLLTLFHEDAYAMSAEEGFAKAGGKIAKNVFKKFSFTGKGAAASLAGKAGLLHTAAGKALVAVVAAAVMGGTAVGVNSMNHNKSNEQTDIEVVLDKTFEETESETESEIVETVSEPVEMVSETAETESETSETESETAETESETSEAESETVETEEDVNLPKSISDEDYPDLLEGELTKDEFEFVLAYGPEELIETGLSDTECEYIRNQFCEISRSGGLNMLTYYGVDSSYRSGYNVNEINRLFSVFTDYRYTEDNDSDTEYGIDVDGDVIWVSSAELNFTAKAEIMDASYTDDEMTVNFHFYKEVDDFEFSRTIDIDKTAILQRNANGNFQLVSITETGDTGDSIDAESSDGQASDGTSDISAVRALYEGVLQDVAEGKYTFPDTYDNQIEGYYYFVTDMDNDDIPELIVGAEYTWDVFYWYDCIVFDVETGELKQIDGNISILSAYIPVDGNGFFGVTNIIRAIGQMDIRRVTIQSGTLLYGETEYDFIIDSDEKTEFTQTNPLVEWTAISDLSGLDEIY